MDTCGPAAWHLTPVLNGQGVVAGSLQLMLASCHAVVARPRPAYRQVWALSVGLAMHAGPLCRVWQLQPLPPPVRAVQDAPNHPAL